MLNDHFPGLGGEAMTLTFDRRDALAHEDRQFLSWEHPMVRGAMEMLTSGELGGAAVTLCSHPDCQAGTLFVEALCVVECTAPAGLEIQRFLPATCLRYLLDVRGEDRSAAFAHDQLSGLCLVQNRKLADTVIKSLGERLKLLLSRAEEIAQGDSLALVDEARHQAEAELGAEQQRLSALAAVNPNVRSEEIEHLTRRREQILAHLDETRIRLDAVRIVVMR